jgi:hypothetical protein
MMLAAVTITSLFQPRIELSITGNPPNIKPLLPNNDESNKAEKLRNVLPLSES